MNIKCDGCGRTGHVTGAILSGSFGNYCQKCINNSTRSASGQSAQWLRDRDREDHQKDMLQPWVNNKPNTEFIRNYPEQAQDMYTEKELKEYG